MFPTETTANYFLRQVVCFPLYMAALGGVVQARSLPCRGEPLQISRLSLSETSFRIMDLAGREYLLAGLQYPDLSFISRARQLKIAGAIGQLLADFLNQEDYTVLKAKNQRDRYGRIPVYIYSNGDGQRYLQQELIHQGLAIVRPDGIDPECSALLFRAEKSAETGFIGFWHEKNQIVMLSNDHNWATRTNGYRIVEGTVYSVGQTGSRFYLNFGENWQRDFTVSVAKRAAKRFKRTVGEMKALTGKKIRVRGWMYSSGGPMIEAYYPGQIELIAD
jgi:hypothetical protein